jgi:hypothetical protein
MPFSSRTMLAGLAQHLHRHGGDYVFGLRDAELRSPYVRNITDVDDTAAVPADRPVAAELVVSVAKPHTRATQSQ